MSKKLGYILAVFILIIGPVLAFAANNTSAKVTLINPLGCNTFQLCVCQIAGALFIIAVPIAILMVVYGAFQMVTSTGDPDKFSTARKTIMYAIVGLAVILVSRGIIIVVYDVLGGKGAIPSC